MVRAYNYTRAKKNRVYDVEAICETFSVHKNTVTNWRKSGLCSIDERQPLLFKGSELRLFLKQRQLEQKQKLRLGQFKCFSCKARTWPESRSWNFEEGTSSRFWAHATCPECEKVVQKVISGAQYRQICKALESNITLQLLDEDNKLVPGDVVKDQGSGVVEYSAENERIIFEFQKYTERYNKKTQDVYLADIRAFEEFLHWKPFDKLKTDDATRYRRYLVAEGMDGRSKSSIAHAASHLRKFIVWLTKQEGYRRLNRSIPDYLELSRADLAGAAGTKIRDYPSMDEVELMISSMPANTLAQQRDRAIVAASFVFGTRADATVSLRLKHVDIDKKEVNQDATEVRTKNSKSMRTFWFPLNDRFDQILIDYMQMLLERGIKDNDALFPPIEILNKPTMLVAENRPIIDPLKSTSAISDAFERACECAGLKKFVPHSARHFLKDFGDKMQLTNAQRKAWSTSLGHETMQTTEAHYARMTTDGCRREFENIRNGITFTEEANELLLRLHYHQLVRDTPEFKRAIALDSEFRKKLGLD
ncbi:tyrosine-type recombinase/integrase [Maritalea sp. S77]|uniref:tyrosine-type recombinase/integrase n=1 Tax=Maritalea sp. S77 TaxID=3415125 RepID=UPI003C7DFB47